MKALGIPDYLIRTINEAPDLSALQTAVSRHLDDIGFSKFAFHMVRKEDDRDRLLTMLNNYPEEWIRRYIDRRYILEDAVHNQALHTILPFQWSSLRQKSATKQSELIFNEATEFSLADGISVPIRGIDRTFSVFSAVADGTAAERAEAISINNNVVTLLASLVHEKAAFLVNSNISPQGSLPKLTAREREVMKWVASVKPAWTFPKCSNCRGDSEYAYAVSTFKLNATTRTHAAVLAVLAGIVDPA